MDSHSTEPALPSWGPAGEKLLRTMRLEASRSGHREIMPGHVLIATLEQPQMYQALRAIGATPNVYAVRALVAASSLGPVQFEPAMPLSPDGEAVVARVRARRDDEPDEALFALVLKEALATEACRALLTRAGSDPDFLARVLDLID